MVLICGSVTSICAPIEVRVCDKLFDLCVEFRNPMLPIDQMRKLYEIRQFLVNNDIELHVSIETFLRDYESRIRPNEKQVMRDAGYLFPEDLDNPKEFL